MSPIKISKSTAEKSVKKTTQVLPVADGKLKSILFGWLALSYGSDHCWDIVKLFRRAAEIDSLPRFVGET